MLNLIVSQNVTSYKLILPLLSAVSTDWAFNSQCLNDSGCALRSRLAYDLNTTARTTTEPWESLALERESSHSRASTPRERRVRDHHLCLLRPNTVSPLNHYMLTNRHSHRLRLHSSLQQTEQMQWRLKDWQLRQFCF